MDVLTLGLDMLFNRSSISEILVLVSVLENMEIPHFLHTFGTIYSGGYSHIHQFLAKVFPHLKLKIEAFLFSFYSNHLSSFPQQKKSTGYNPKKLRG